MEIKIVKEPIKKSELLKIAGEEFDDLLKAVVDVEKEIMAVGGELHSDEEILLMEQEGSSREHTWGINIYPKKSGDEMFEFDSMINLKPAFGNRSRDIDDPKIKEKIKQIIEKIIVE